MVGRTTTRRTKEKKYWTSFPVFGDGKKKDSPWWLVFKEFTLSINLMWSSSSYKLERPKKEEREDEEEDCKC